jgi:hypothetical protein
MAKLPLETGACSDVKPVAGEAAVAGRLRPVLPDDLDPNVGTRDDDGAEDVVVPADERGSAKTTDDDELPLPLPEACIVSNPLPPPPRPPPPLFV